MMQYLWAFLIGGAICTIGQLLLSLTKLTPPRILVLFVTLGVLLGAIGGGLVAVTGSGCSSLTPSAKTQTMGVYAFGIPGIAVITQSTQDADNTGDDDNTQTQVNPVTVKPNLGK